MKRWLSATYTPPSALHVATARRMVSANGTMSPTKEGELSARGEASDSERDPRVKAYI